jgi:hypothetical protein
MGYNVTTCVSGTPKQLHLYICTNVQPVMWQMNECVLEQYSASDC